MLWTKYRDHAVDVVQFSQNTFIQANRINVFLGLDQGGEEVFRGAPDIGAT